MLSENARVDLEAARCGLDVQVAFERISHRDEQRAYFLHDLHQSREAGARTALRRCFHHVVDRRTCLTNEAVEGRPSVLVHEGVRILSFWKAHYSHRDPRSKQDLGCSASCLSPGRISVVDGDDFFGHSDELSGMFARERGTAAGDRRLDTRLMERDDVE